LLSNHPRPRKRRFKIDSSKDTRNLGNCPSLTSNMRSVVKPNIDELSYTVSPQKVIHLATTTTNNIAATI
jgi:hypothetical protein